MMRILLLTVLLCASVTAVPSIPDTLLIDDWVLCGPFMVGAREFLTGVVDDPLNFRPQVGDSYPSSLVQGGYAVTRVISPDSTGWLETNYPDVLWDSIQTWYGVTGLTGAGFAYAEFELPGPRRALALSPGLGGFVLNGRSYTGDYYASNYYLVPVELDSGTNRVLLRLSGFGDQRFRFALAPAAHAVLSVTADATLPDLTADQALTAWAGIPLLNTTGEQLDAVRLRVRRADELVADTLINGLPAFGAGNIPVQLTLPAVSRDSIDPVLRLVCEVIADGDTAIDTLRVAIRRPDEAHRRTFISSIDGSCQFYGLRYPADYDPDRNYPVILLLHGGAGDAYSWAKFPVQKDWAFVVTPTNRRPYGFNWQDWGRLDCIEVLDTALTRLPIDPDRVLISGGSMGGHGSWHVATSHPDRFAVVAPIASWSTIQLYIPGIFQRSAIFAEPGVLAFREMVLQSDNVPGMLSNLNNLPAFILHGGADGMVPPLMARGLAGWLDELGYEYQYKEVPERGHWWRYEDLDISVVDDPDLLEYIRDRKRVSAPRQVRYRTADLGTSSGAYWVSIERVRTVGRFADIRAEVVGDSIAIETGNISQFRLELNEQLLPSGTADIIIDGQSAGRVSAVTGPSGQSVPAQLTFHHRQGRWRKGAARVPAVSKRPEVYGPARQAMMKPFLLVYGTGDTGITGFLRHSATQEAMRWWLISNGYARVMPDTAVTDSLARGYNLVLYGGPDENRLTGRLAGDLPLQVRKGRLHLSEQDLGEDLAAVFVYPNPLNHDRLVLVRMGTDAEHTRLANFWSLASSSTGIPDFMVYDSTVRRYGWAGVKAAGFFGSDWQLDPASSYLPE